MQEKYSRNKWNANQPKWGIYVYDRYRGLEEGTPEGAGEATVCVCNGKRRRNNRSSGVFVGRPLQKLDDILDTDEESTRIVPVESVEV